jgi:IS30 family transposase
MTHTVLSLAERIELQTGLKSGETQAKIARSLGRSASAISAELKRNAGRVNYSAVLAHKAATERMGRARRGHCAIEQTSPLREAVHTCQRSRGFDPPSLV